MIDIPLPNTETTQQAEYTEQAVRLEALFVEISIGGFKLRLAAADIPVYSILPTHTHTHPPTHTHTRTHARTHAHTHTHIHIHIHTQSCIRTLLTALKSSA